jgi:serine/threonine-protein kinase
MEGGIPKGTRIGTYVIDALIGRGGMGIVYRAYHPMLDRWAAIKLLPPFQHGTEARQRFEREARAVAKLRHRHILTVYEFGEYAGQPYMVVEYMPNGSLADRMPSAPLTPGEALTLLRPLGDALDYAHGQGILHRDVKPANVFLDAEMQPVLADFGLAKMVSEQSLTASGMVSGTPTHISPEQVSGQPLTAATDLYSLGVIAFQLLTARLPFTADGFMEVLYAHVHTAPPAPSSINPALTQAVDHVVLRALAKEPSTRWPSARALTGALEAAVVGRHDTREARPPVPAAIIEPPAAAPTLVAQPAPPAGPAARTAAVAPAAADSTATRAAPAAPAPEPAVPTRRSRYGLLLAAAVVLIALVVGLAGATRLAGAIRPSARVTPGTTTSPTASVTGRPTAARYLRVEPPSPLRPGTPITVSGRGLDPKLGANAGILQDGVVHPVMASLPVAPDGSFSSTGVVPTDLKAGSAALVACNFDARGRSDLTRCLSTPVTLNG